MSRESNNCYEAGLLVDGFDYDLQIWVKDGRCEQIGLNCALYGGLSWLEARLQAFGLEEHLKPLHESPAS